MSLTITIAAKFFADDGEIIERTYSSDEADNWNDAGSDASFSQFCEDRVEIIARNLGWADEKGFIEWAGYDVI